MGVPIDVTLYTDPGCPWAYSELPALRVLDWRYGSQLSWRLVVIGLSEDTSRYLERGYTPLRGAMSQVRFRRYGMPFSPTPKERVSATARGCRALVAVRLDGRGEEWQALRALQLANFTTPLLLDDEAQLATVLGSVPGIDGSRIVSRLDDPDVTEAYEHDRAEARTAAGSPAELQGKTGNSDGSVRFTAPSVVFERDGQRLVAGGFQPVEAYDILLANLDPQLEREQPPETPLPLLERFPEGLTTQEVAALMARDNDAPDRARAELALLELTGSEATVRNPLGDDALWRLSRSPQAAAA
ncbi:MAG TPA: DsbA family protein [Gaiellaceae bacterium]|jgi:2-hydroxychromene-2-carboxylate isomerase|nr:DsbA family protein [Gaiellaceae bacterium]